MLRPLFYAIETIQYRLLVSWGILRPQWVGISAPTTWSLLPPVSVNEVDGDGRGIQSSVLPQGLRIWDSMLPPSVWSPDSLNNALWFAVPKSKITRHKKRLKTTVQKRIPLRQNIVTDPRTGQKTLMHHMPFNWKDYLLPDVPLPTTTKSVTTTDEARKS